MYTIKEFTDKSYRFIQLSNTQTKSWVKVCPERGGIITGFGVDGEELLYLNEDTFYDRGKNIRGGIPILFPISGQLTDGKYEWNGRTYQMPNHGFARIKPWEVIKTEQTADNQASITIRLKSDSETKQFYPFDFEILFTYILKNNTLTINQTYKNLSNNEMPIYAGLHPYFKTETKEIELETTAMKYFDYNDQTVKDFSGSINLNGMKESVALLDSGNQISAQLSHSKILIEYGQPYKYMVLWVEEGQDFVCLEPWMAKTNELNKRGELTMIPPGGCVEATVVLRACHRPNFAGDFYKSTS